MSKMSRRNQFAFALAARRTADFYARAGQARLLCLLVTACAFAVGQAAWWAWIALGLAALGSWQGWGLSRAVLRDEVPRNPLLLWAYNSATGGHGKHTVNVPGMFEGLSCISLGLAATYAIPNTNAALVALAFVVAYSVSVFSALFVDNANYNPHDKPWPGFEILRQGVGPILAVLSAALVLPGWSGPSVVPPALVCAFALVASVRVRETDRAFVDAYREARESERLAGRDDVLNQVHGLSTDIDRALMFGASIRDDRPELFEYIQTASVKLQQLTALEDPYLDEVDYPETLSRAVRRLAASRGAWGVSVIRVARISETDHQLARVLVSDLVGNASKAGAGTITMRFEHIDGRTVRLSVEDDAGPFPSGTWMAPGSSLARLGRTLANRAGTLTLEASNEKKAVTAIWRLTGDGT